MSWDALQAAIDRVGNGEPTRLDLPTNLDTTARERFRIVDAQGQGVLHGLQMRHVRAHPDSRLLVEEVGLVLPAPSVLEVDVELVAWRGKLVLSVERCVREALSSSSLQNQ